MLRAPPPDRTRDSDRVSASLRHSTRTCVERLGPRQPPRRKPAAPAAHPQIRMHFFAEPLGPAPPRTRSLELELTCAHKPTLEPESACAPVHGRAPDSAPAFAQPHQRTRIPDPPGASARTATRASRSALARAPEGLRNWRFDLARPHPTPRPRERRPAGLSTGVKMCPAIEAGGKQLPRRRESARTHAALFAYTTYRPSAAARQRSFASDTNLERTTSQHRPGQDN